MKFGKIFRALFFAVIACAAIGYMFCGYIIPVFAGWPLSVDSASDEVIALLTEKQKAEFASASHDQLILYHFGLGTAIRNEFGLWGANWLLLQSACENPCHPDEASMIIIERAWERLRAQQIQK